MFCLHFEAIYGVNSTCSIIFREHFEAIYGVNTIFSSHICEKCCFYSCPQGVFCQFWPFWASKYLILSFQMAILSFQMAICSFQRAILMVQMAILSFHMAISSSKRLPVLQRPPPLVWPPSLKNGTRAT